MDLANSSYLRIHGLISFDNKPIPTMEKMPKKIIPANGIFFGSQNGPRSRKA